MADESFLTAITFARTSTFAFLEHHHRLVSTNSSTKHIHRRRTTRSYFYPCLIKYTCGSLACCWQSPILTWLDLLFRVGGNLILGLYPSGTQGGCGRVTRAVATKDLFCEHFLLIKEEVQCPPCESIMQDAGLMGDDWWLISSQKEYQNVNNLDYTVKYAPRL